MLTAEIIKAAERYHQEMITWRRQFHQHPELGFQEAETAAYIVAVLTKLGLEVESGIAKTGVVATLRSGKPGKTIALRADMDALPVLEQNEVPYRSQNQGVMHACGHDAHMAIVLGAAAVLTELKEQLVGNIKFIFQPAEEGAEGTFGGAKPMIEAGVLQNPEVAHVLGAHVWPGLPVGTAAIKEGPVMASSTGWDLTVTGKGGHGAVPHLSIDSIAIASQIVVALQQIVSRTCNPMEPAVFTVGQFNAGTRHNIIAETAELSGTLRTFNRATKERILKLAADIASNIAAPFGATCNFRTKVGGVDPTVNDAQLAAKVIASAHTILGEGKVITKFDSSMGGEDFSYFDQAVPSCYFFIGVSSDKVDPFPIHHGRFDIDEKALYYGALVFAQATVDLLFGK